MSLEDSSLAVQMEQLVLRDVDGGCTLAVRAHPGARRDAITGVQAGALKVSLTAPPENGRANAALIGLLADSLQVQRSQIALLIGATSRAKTLRVQMLTASQLRARLHAVHIQASAATRRGHSA
jgi:uncharacterized protein (TIGR00251 family)